MSVPYCAVVGSGPAALGTVAGLLSRNPDARIVIFDHGVSPAGIPPQPVAPEALEQHYTSVYGEIWSRQRRAFPPPTAHFGPTLPKFSIDGRERIFRSETFGGLSNFWGATCLPFTDRELEGWPVTRAQLEPHYESMARDIGV